MTSEYEILCNISIDKLQHQPSSTLYKTLQKVKQEFKPNQKIVFTCFSEVKQTTLEHVFWCLAFVDIPLWFVHVETSIAWIADYCTAQDSNINVHIESGTAPVVDDYDAIFYNKHICPHPWIGYWIWPNGSTAPCCEYNGSWNNLNVKEHSHEQILYSEEMESLREQFRTNKTPSGCKQCLRNVPSRRDITPFKLSNVIGTIDYEGPGQMSYVGGHFGNLCNLKCRICSSDFSSQIAAEDIKYGDDVQAAQARQKIKIGRWSKKSTDFWQYLANTPTIKNFEFLGGEPFLLKELIGYVENLALSGHSRDCMFDIVTNGTVVPDVIIKHHSKFKRIGITFSIDDIEDRFELQRKNATWHEVNQNIRMMSNLDNVHARCNTTVNVMNVYYLPELIDWWHTIDSSENLHISTGLTNPAHLDIAHMPKKAADAVYDKLYASPHRLLLQPILDKLSNTSTDMSKDFITYTKFKDTIRNENFANSHPEIAALYNY